MRRLALKYKYILNLNLFCPSYYILATGRTKNAVEEDYERDGDLGIVALTSRTNQKTLSFLAKPKPLSASFILDQLRQIAQVVH